MPLTKKAPALAAGLVAALAAATIAQQPRAESKPESLSIAECTVDWIEISEVSALREGVIDKMELQVGDTVDQNGLIGTLHSELAALTAKKAAIAAKNVGPIRKGEAQQKLAQAVIARDWRLLNFNTNQVSAEDLQKHEAELNVAEAMILEAKENQELAKAEFALAQETLDEHKILAPFKGSIIELKKRPGESVRANEAVVRLGNVDKLRLVGRIPIEYALRVRVGDIVEVTPNIPNAVLPLEQLKFRGKITFVDPEAEPVKNDVRIFAEVKNDADHRLMPGLKADMIVSLNTAGKDAPPPSAVSVKAVRSPVTTAATDDDQAPRRAGNRRRP
jgi:RND family efflux transporter MFP subunit